MYYPLTAGSFTFNGHVRLPLCEFGDVSTPAFGYDPFRSSIVAYDANEKLGIHSGKTVMVTDSRPELAYYLWKYTQGQRITFLSADIDEVNCAEERYSSTPINFEFGKLTDPQYANKFDILMCDNEFLSATLTPERLVELMQVLRPGGRGYFHTPCRVHKWSKVDRYLNYSVDESMGERILKLINASASPDEMLKLMQCIPELVKKKSFYQNFSGSNAKLHNARGTKEMLGYCYDIFTTIFMCERA
jgi:hypothetical protein